jgi:hypothetical protein
MSCIMLLAFVCIFNVCILLCAHVYGHHVMMFVLGLLLWTINDLNFDTLSGISVQII